MVCKCSKLRATIDYPRPWLQQLYQKLSPAIKERIKKRKWQSDHEMVKVTMVQGERKVYCPRWLVSGGLVAIFD